MVGYAWQKSSIENCYHNGAVTNTSSGSTGGVVGQIKVGAVTNTEITVMNCYNIGSVSGVEGKTAAIVGYSEFGDYEGVISVKNCFFIKTEHDVDINGEYTECDITGISTSLMKKIAEDLGSPFIANTSDSLNDGYPVFYWQLESKQIGDINNDGIISVVDAVILQKHLLNIEPLNSLKSYAADTNQDTVIDAFDLAILKRMLLAS